MTLQFGEIIKYLEHEVVVNPLHGVRKLGISFVIIVIITRELWKHETQQLRHFST